MYSRAERDTTVKAASATTEKVGPGSYAVVPGRKVVLSAAPFTSNTKRSVCEPSASKLQQPPSSREAVDSSPHLTSTTDSNRGSLTSKQQYSHKSSFASGTTRSAPDKRAAQQPGPGTYQTAPKWTHQQSAPAAASHRTEASKRVTTLLGPSAAATAAITVQDIKQAATVPLLTPPSIPARHQSYGYEDGPGGVLLMQAAPAGSAETDSSDLHSSKPATAVGPGTGWSASKTNRWSRQQRGLRPQQRPQQQQGPAPGSYNPDHSTATRLRMGPDGKLVPCRVTGRGSYSSVGSAAFASTAARPHQQEIDPEKATPGPGAYRTATTTRPSTAPQPAAAGGFKPAHSPAPEQQLFGRTAGRSSAVGWGPGTSGKPSVPADVGPGSYDLSSAGALRRSVRGGGLKSGLAAAAGGLRESVVGGGEAGDAGGGAFGSTQNRFEDAWTVSPGPGRYIADQVISMSTEVARKTAAASKRGVFGSASDRFTAAGAATSSSGTDPALVAVTAAGSAGDAAVGPGQYDVGSEIARSAATAAARRSAGFASAVKRFETSPERAPPAAPDYSCWDGNPDSLRGDAARLGPGAYIKLDDWRSESPRRSGSASRHPSYHMAPFGSEAGRSTFAAEAARSVAPGPGAYDSAAVDMKEVFRPLSVPSSSRAGFSGSSKRFGSSATVVPGPGAYTADVSHTCSLVKPSYNVTLE